MAKSKTTKSHTTRKRTTRKTNGKSSSTTASKAKTKVAPTPPAQPAEEEPDPETLEQVGWLLLDAAEYQRDLAGGQEVPADKWLRGSARRDLLRRSRKLADEGDPLGVADQITDLVKQANSDSSS